MTPKDAPVGPILVDTDVATWVMRNDQQALPWRPLLRGHLLVLSFVNVGELLAVPVVKGWQSRRAAAWVEEIRRHFVVLPFTLAVTEQWAPLHVRYRGHLQKGGANDLWIAASALSADPVLPLATGNLSDFSKVAEDFPLQLIHPNLPPQ